MQFITLNVHFFLQHDACKAARRAGPSATADTYCYCVACLEDQVQCENTGYCIPATWLCDGIDSCGDWSDELNCCESYFGLFNCSLCIQCYALTLLGGRQEEHPACKN